jgi:histidinol phosphatase-like enzyme
VGISAAFFFITEVQEAASRLTSKIFRYQMAIVTNQTSCLATPRNMKRFDDAAEQAPAFHE